MVGVRGTADQAARPETWIPTWVRRCGMRFGVSWPLATGWLFDSADQNRDQADCPRQIMTSREHSPKSISGGSPLAHLGALVSLTIRTAPDKACDRRNDLRQEFLYRWRWVEQHPILRYRRFGAHAAVKTTWPPPSGFQLRPRHFYSPLTRFQSIGGADPADPFPACHWRDVQPQAARLWIGRERTRYVGWHLRLRPFFSRLNRQRHRVAHLCSNGFALGFTDFEPVAARTVRFQRGLKLQTINSPLDHNEAPRRELRAGVLGQPENGP